MSATDLQIMEIESRFDGLPLNARLSLLKRLIQRVRQTEESAWATDLAAMAQDPEIQRELRKIDEEFRQTELDGLQ